MANVVLHKDAERDFADAFAWYYERSPAAAADFDNALHNALTQIASSFATFPRLDKRHRYFLLTPFPYLVVFRQEAMSIIVVAIAHGRRQAYWKRRK